MKLTASTGESTSGGVPALFQLDARQKHGRIKSRNQLPLHFKVATPEFSSPSRRLTFGIRFDEFGFTFDCSCVLTQLFIQGRVKIRAKIGLNLRIDPKKTS